MMSCKIRENLGREAEMTPSRDAKSLSQARYTEYADGYISSETHAKGSDLDRLVAMAQPQAHWEALDVATGGGHTALKFAPYVKRVTATDLTARMLEKAAAFIAGEQAAGHVVFQQADAENLPFGAAQFDLVTCRIAPHHFPDVGRFIRECARVLKSGGVLLLQDHLLPADDEAARYVDGFERRRDPSHQRAFNAAEWKAMFAAAGLRVEYAETYIKRHVFLDWARRQGNDERTISALVRMVEDAPPTAKDWLDARDWGSEAASFVNHHILIRGRTP